MFSFNSTAAKAIMQIEHACSGLKGLVGTQLAYTIHALVHMCSLNSTHFDPESNTSGSASSLCMSRHSDLYSTIQNNDVHE